MAASLSRSLWSRVADVASLATTPLAPSHYLALVSPLRATHTLNARVESVWGETTDTRTLTLRPGRGWRTHRAGQFVRVGAEVDGRVVTRTYSIASAPGRKDGCIAITVKAVAGGKMSGHLARDVKPGDYLTLAPPQGDFVLPDGPPVRPLFLTAGSGITPVMSMVRTLAARRSMPDVVHVHYAPRAQDAIFGAELARLAAEIPSYRFVLVTTRDGDASDAHASRFGRAQLDALVPDWETRAAWACGPQGFLGAIESAFAAAGRDEEAPRRALPPEPRPAGSERLRGARPLRPQPRRRRGERPYLAPPGRRERRSDRAARVPDGHLPLLRRDDGVGLRARPAHRPPDRRAGSARPDLRLRGCRRRRALALISSTKGTRR